MPDNQGAECWKMHFSGQVQGVGFRPFVHRLALEMGLKGWVKNGLSGVEVRLQADEELGNLFYRNILTNLPFPAKITESRLEKVQNTFFEKFEILESSTEGNPSLIITPDMATCEFCLVEMQNPADRRFNYPFITCTQCGPRYSILEKLPFDRENTTMAVFEMCHLCQAEYENPADRRYFSQTNSCPECGVKMNWFENKTEQNLTQQEILEQTVQNWKAGKIVAIKALSGYLLTCDANNLQIVRNLRKRKHRPAKPFALMYPGLESLKTEMWVSEKEQKRLLSPEAPVILLERKSEAHMPNQPVFEEIAPGLSRVGVMLPHTPLFWKLLRDFGKPIVATSGNPSGSPVVFTDEKAVTELSEIADAVLTHNRRIVIPQDDSVLKISRLSEKNIFLRRSRGFAPGSPASQNPSANRLAMGALLKSTFAFSSQENVYLSQYLGDLDNYDTQQHYQLTIRHLLNVTGMQPEQVITDRHPDYFSTHLGEEMGIPVQKIQHHQAHLAAVLAENEVMPGGEAVLGVIWDGAGLGNNGNIWGGEFFRYEDKTFKRIAHFEEFPHLSADKMAREPRLSALALCYHLPEAEVLLKKKFSVSEWKIYMQVLEKYKENTNKNLLKTTGTGRIFDAIASLLGLCDLNTFEGQAALLLENRAFRNFKHHSPYMKESYFETIKNFDSISTGLLLQNVLKDIEAKKHTDFIAAKFHFSLIDLIKQVVVNQNIKQIAFSGGVFQNEILVDLASEYLKNYRLYFHKNLSPNDENIAFGQLMFNFYTNS
jgi:hydrogenase maturation protein HypF